MNKRYIKFKDVWAAPGSQLHKLLSEGRNKEALACHEEATARADKLLRQSEALSRPSHAQTTRADPGNQLAAGKLQP